MVFYKHGISTLELQGRTSYGSRHPTQPKEGLTRSSSIELPEVEMAAEPEKELPVFVDPGLQAFSMRIGVDRSMEERKDWVPEEGSSLLEFGESEQLSEHFCQGNGCYGAGSGDEEPPKSLEHPTPGTGDEKQPTIPTNTGAETGPPNLGQSYHTKTAEEIKSEPEIRLHPTGSEVWTRVPYYSKFKSWDHVKSKLVSMYEVHYPNGFIFEPHLRRMGYARFLPEDAPWKDELNARFRVHHCGMLYFRMFMQAFFRARFHFKWIAAFPGPELTPFFHIADVLDEIQMRLIETALEVRATANLTEKKKRPK